MILKTSKIQKFFKPRDNSVPALSFVMLKAARHNIFHQEEA